MTTKLNNLPDWDLTDFYSSTSDKQIEEDFPNIFK